MCPIGAQFPSIAPRHQGTSSTSRPPLLLFTLSLLTHLQNPVCEQLPQLSQPLPRAGTDKHALHRIAIELVHILQVRRLTFGLYGIQLVEDQNLRHIVSPDFRQNFLNLLYLFRETWVGRIHDMQQQIGIDGFLQRGLEGIDQTVRQVADKAHGIGQETDSSASARYICRVVVSSVANSWSAA